MNKNVKSIVSVVLLSSMAFSVAGCSLFDKANKQCLEVGDEFLKAAIEREIEDMADLCIDEDEALLALSRYANSVDEIDCLLEKAEFKATEKNCSTKDGKGTITYVVKIPDYEAALDEDPEDADEFVDLIDDMKDTTEFEIKLSFKLKKDKWYIKDAQDFVEDFYEYFDEIDFPFASPYANQISNTNWYFTDNGSQENPVYNAYTSDIDLQIWVDGEPRLNYTLTYEGDVIYESTGSDAWIYDDEVGDNFVFEPGVYTITFYDADGRLVYSDSCTVE